MENGSLEINGSLSIEGGDDTEKSFQFQMFSSRSGCSSHVLYTKAHVNSARQADENKVRFLERHPAHKVQEGHNNWRNIF
jgi:hypothetical protein